MTSLVVNKYSNTPPLATNWGRPSKNKHQLWPFYKIIKGVSYINCVSTPVCKHKQAKRLEARQTCYNGSQEFGYRPMKYKYEEKVTTPSAKLFLYAKELKILNDFHRHRVRIWMGRNGSQMYFLATSQRLGLFSRIWHEVLCNAVGSQQSGKVEQKKVYSKKYPIDCNWFRFGLFPNYFCI